MAIVIVALLVFIAGATAGVILVVTLGIHHEERAWSLTREAPSHFSRGARGLTGLYVRQRSDEPTDRPDLYV